MFAECLFSPAVMVWTNYEIMNAKNQLAFAYFFGEKMTWFSGQLEN